MKRRQNLPRWCGRHWTRAGTSLRVVPLRKKNCLSESPINPGSPVASFVLPVSIIGVSGHRRNDSICQMTCRKRRDAVGVGLHGIGSNGPVMRERS